MNHEYYKRNPWLIHFLAARQRCYPKNHYGKRGIKFFMTSQDFKFLWFRDKAWLLVRPSIHRINNDGNYTLENCKYIELKENIEEGRKSRVYKCLTKEHKRKLNKAARKTPITQLDLGGNIVKRFKSMTEAAQAIKVFKQDLSAVLRKKPHHKTCKGYKWQYTNN